MNTAQPHTTKVTLEDIRAARRKVGGREGFLYSQESTADAHREEICRLECLLRNELALEVLANDKAAGSGASLINVETTVTISLVSIGTSRLAVNAEPQKAPASLRGGNACAKNWRSPHPQEQFLHLNSAMESRRPSQIPLAQGSVMGESENKTVQ